KSLLAKGYRAKFLRDSIVKAVYRPFLVQWQYFDRRLNELVYQMPRIFPDSKTDNRVLQVSGTGVRAGFSALMSQALPSYDLVEKGQCFPLYLYEEPRPDDGLFTASYGEANGLTRRDAITDEGLAYFQAAYPGEEISKEDLFYYIYGLLHSPDYRERFANNLAKQL